MARIFLVEDNDAIREAVAGYFELAEHEVVQFSGVGNVQEVMAHKAPDLLIIDVMLPDGNGFALAKKIRRVSKVPFIFLTAREQESDRITGFEIGADDYVVKPFSSKELVLRAEAVLRRSGGGTAEGGASLFELEGHYLKIHRDAHSVELDNRGVKLTGAEWNILSYLSGNYGVLLSRERILGECLDYSYEGSERTVDTHIKNLRGKLEKQPWIETVRSFGYKFQGIPKEISPDRDTETG